LSEKNDLFEESQAARPSEVEDKSAVAPPSERASGFMPSMDAQSQCHSRHNSVWFPSTKTKKIENEN